MYKKSSMSVLIRFDHFKENENDNKKRPHR